MMTNSFQEAINSKARANNKEHEVVMATIAATSAKKIPAGKTPVSAELLSKMQQHYHRLAKKHPLWSAERLRTATGGFFGVEFINDEEPNAD